LKTQKHGKWRYEEDLADLNKPVDKTRWGMSPQTVNAYYNASYNEIVFPAAILQPPFYNYQADEAVNMEELRGYRHEISWFRRFRITIQCRRELVDCGQQRIQNNFQR
jgi:endothelin-converting enzyme/putative endopeptidase